MIAINYKVHANKFHKNIHYLYKTLKSIEIYYRRPKYSLTTFVLVVVLNINYF